MKNLKNNNILIKGKQGHRGPTGEPGVCPDCSFAYNSAYNPYLQHQMKGPSGNNKG